ncbi:MAG: hypothetical protein ABIX44_07015 [Cryobacterium sp.]
MLAGRIRYETAQIAQAQEEVDRGSELIDPTPRVGNYFSALPGAHQATALLESAEFTEAVRLREGRDRLAGPVRAVNIAVVAWRAEQKRLAAAKARAARAARALSVTVARARLHSRAIVAPARPGRSTPARAAKYTKNVWTAGWQAQIDACRGAVDLTGHYGVRVIAEHWGCGGSRFPRSGTVRLSGRYAGTYTVGRIVAVLDVRSQGTRNVPRGYGLLYQTCLNGSNATMAFRVLTRVG